MSTPRCPTCRAPLGPATDPGTRPFCSTRCKLVDLDRWLRGDYRIPGASVELDPRDPSGAMREPGEA